MFCYQCEQTSRTGDRPGCATTIGVCGKDETTADLQDLLLYMLQGIGQYAARARALGVTDREADGFILYAAFTTLTNVNFNASRFVTMIGQAGAHRDRLRTAYEQAAGADAWQPTGPAAFQPATTLAELTVQAKEHGVMDPTVSEDIAGLRALNLYGLKGVCAYAYHAFVLGQASEEVFAALEKHLDFLASAPTDIDALLAEALNLGTVNFTVMGLLDAANTGTFGQPEITQVRTTTVAGPSILVSGHDMRDLEEVLKATEGTGINVYTHGELLPANAYPGMKKYAHLVGNFGGAWQDQQTDFVDFPGAILLTSNCLIEPKPQYRQRIFTSGPVGWPGLRHLDGDFTPLVQAAKALPPCVDQPEESITIGFARNTVLSVAGDVVEAVKSGALTHFFLIGGCDGPTPGRNYYTEFADNVPDSTAILTLGCAKYRFNKHEFGAIGGIPRLLDIGQCNDTYSAVQIALALAEAFECEVNDLPLTLVIAWFEQKATAVLLTLLALGLRNIKIGPTLPAYLTPAVVDVLVDKFALAPLGDVQADIASSLAGAGA
ncbi:MAG: hydroxylamine reductase [Propionibacteriaceae bacterium]|nr:hydroxylamine reductase [Propionibacteriaceae bacterium]